MTYCSKGVMFKLEYSIILQNYIKTESLRLTNNPQYLHKRTILRNFTIWKHQYLIELSSAGISQISVRTHIRGLSYIFFVNQALQSFYAESNSCV